MIGRTHLTVGCAAWVTANAVVTGPQLWPLTLGTLAAGLGALLPDLDRYWWARRITGGHRHATHSLIGLTAATVLVLVGDDFLPRGPWWLVPAVALGWLTHIATDSMTRSGCPWLWPSERRFWLLPKAMRISTGGKRRSHPGLFERSRGLAYGEWITTALAVAGSAAVCWIEWR